MSDQFLLGLVAGISWIPLGIVIGYKLRGFMDIMRGPATDKEE